MSLSLPSLSAETWTAIAAAAGSGLVLLKKLTSKSKPKPEYITRAEFHHELTAMRDRIGAGYLAIAEKLDSNHKELSAAIDRLAIASEHRLDTLESTVARLDERTKL